MNKPDKRSPLKSKPLRVAGQSLDEAIQKVLDDEVSEGAAFIALSVMIAAYEWWRMFYSSPPQPVAMTIAAGLMVAWGFRKMFKARAKLRQLRLGRDGERAVAEILERMRESGFRVFHDIVGPSFNVDHVLVGAQGLFVIETKTISKPGNGSPTIQYDGEQITVAGFTPDRDPVRQATAIASWVRDFVKESSGRQIPVRPVVLYPGWFVEKPPSLRPTVWVLNPKALADFIGREPAVLSPEDVKLVAFHLSRYVRAEAAAQEA